MSSTVTRLLALAFTVLMSAPAQAQFGGGGFGGVEILQEYLPAGTVASTNVIIVPSKSKKSVSGYSDAGGEWETVSIEPHPELGIVPVVGTDVAVIKGKQHLHAFGAQSGTWATLEVGEAIDEAEVVVDQTRATFLTETHFHVFSSVSGKWASLDLTKD